MNDQMSDDEFRLFRELIRRECGLYFAENKKSFLASRIGKRVAAKSMRSFYGYYRHLQEADGGRRKELLLLLDLLTINETNFFRNRPQFQLLEQVVLPELLEAKAASSPLRIWSAGCSTGQEPYSIAISVLEAQRPGRRCDFQVFASDLSLSVLETASRGIYPATRVKEVDPRRLRRYFDACPEGYAVRDEVKRAVIYDFHNLKHENGLRNLDIIFCRNVLIYFDPEEQKKVLDKFIAALNPGGYLFLGHSESAQGLTEELEFMHRDKGTAYRKAAA